MNEYTTEKLKQLKKQQSMLETEYRNIGNTYKT